MLLSNPEFVQNPYPIYSKLKKNRPLCFDEQTKSWLVLSVDIAKQIISNEEDFTCISAERLAKLGKGNSFFENFLKNWFLYQDKDKHRFFRRTVGAYFTPKKLVEIKGFIKEISESVLVELPPEEFNFITKYASRIAVEVLCKMLGVAKPDKSKITNLVNIMASFIYFPKEAKDIRKFSFGAEALHQYITEVIKEQNYTDNGVISYLIELQKKGAFTREEVIYNILLFFVAGAETPRSGITNCFVELQNDLKSQEAFLSNKEMQNNYVDEILRIEAPISYISRTNKKQEVINGITIPKGSHIVIMVNAVNHDTSLYSNPERIDFNRSKGKFYTFGDGIHSCLGYHLAKLEIEVALDTILSKYPNWKIDADRKWIPRFGLRTFEKLIVKQVD